MEDTTVGDVLIWAGWIVTGITYLAALTPNPTDNVIAAYAKGLLNLIAANWGAAANEVKMKDVIKEKQRNGKPPGK